MTGLSDVLIAAGSNQNIKYMLQGTTLILWVGDMVQHAPEDATTGHISGDGDSFLITLIDDQPFMPSTPRQLM